MPPTPVVPQATVFGLDFASATNSPTVFGSELRIDGDHEERIREQNDGRDVADWIVRRFDERHAAMNGLQSVWAAAGVKSVGARPDQIVDEVLAIPYEAPPFHCEGYIFKKGDQP